jgi:hypothetical protein
MHAGDVVRMPTLRRCYVWLARCRWQCPTVPGRAHEPYDSSILVCPRNLPDLLIDILLVSLKTESRAIGYRLRRAFERCSRRLCQLESQDTAKIRQGFPGESDRSSVAESDYCCVMME